MPPADANNVEEALRESGYSTLGQLFDGDACRRLTDYYGEPHRFRSRIRMEQFRFGRGEYQYFAYPLPPEVVEARERLYGMLAGPARRWMDDLGAPTHYPETLPEFLAQCHKQGQVRPTPLLLHYGPGDYNCLHQDLYGEVAFPFQVVVGLSRPGLDFEGGELTLVEQQPRAQSIVRVIPLVQGEAVVITTRFRPVRGGRGFYRTNVRHGVSPIRLGERYTLGLIFHDAK